MKITKLLQDLGTARTEQQTFTYSVYKRFVVPPALIHNDLREIKHSTILQGSRGCGKTTYIRYFSHWTQFDKTRTHLEAEDVSAIVLYWKPDTAFFRSMNYGWLTEKESYNFFMTISGLELFHELMSALDNISHHWPEVIDDLEESNDFWDNVFTITGTVEHSFSSQLKWAKKALYQAEVAIKKPDCSNLADILPSAMFKLLIPVIQTDCNKLRDVRFSLFVDEFENLSEKQQKIINGYRKGSNASLTWNVAHKRFAKISTMTDGDEQLNNVDDFRNLFMEEIYGAKCALGSAEGVYERTLEIELFTSEVFIHGLLKENITSGIEGLNVEVLIAPNKVGLRRKDGYKDNVMKFMRNLFPEPTTPKLAELAMKQGAVKNLVQKQIEKFECIPRQLIKQFIQERPGDALVSWCISQQKTFKGEVLLDYIQNKQDMKKSYAERIKTYRVAALLSLNTLNYINIPIYSGFDRFLNLSQSNIRHFIELCYQSLHQLNKDVDIQSLSDIPPVSYEQMHQGAIQTSKSFIGKVISFEPMGQKLSQVANRLGILFQSYQRQSIQSEPERVSIVIKGIYGDLPEELHPLLESAKCWRVLIEDNITRDRKSRDTVSSSSQYRLNPLCAPNFGISYRQGRTVEVSLDDFLTICIGDNLKFKQWLSSRIDKDQKSLDQMNLI